MFAQTHGSPCCEERERTRARDRPAQEIDQPRPDAEQLSQPRVSHKHRGEQHTKEKRATEVRPGKRTDKE